MSVVTIFPPLVATAPRWLRKGQRVVYIPNLTCPMPHPDWVTAEGVQIDASIAPLIWKLNCLGYKTDFCCSGLSEDHRNYVGSLEGYVSFEGEMPPARLLPPNMRALGRTIRMNKRGNKVVRATWLELEGALDEE